ncbi:hypothetical protein B0H10DRAFT_1951916 [Mycena sp. CBHHK59/15]|nr:hypothetical protein B0H10DRAFT_1951916 [Mycena sp. CBHHK59/15]
MSDSKLALSEYGPYTVIWHQEEFGTVNHDTDWVGHSHTPQVSGVLPNFSHFFQMFSFSRPFPANFASQPLPPQFPPDFRRSYPGSMILSESQAPLQLGKNFPGSVSKGIGKPTQTLRFGGFLRRKTCQTGGPSGVGIRDYSSELLLYGTHTVQKVFFTCHANDSDKQCQLESRKQLWEQTEVQQALQQDTTS